ncbi:MAG: hypothetical protein V1850_07490 [Candidatus Bathyarchaeota archaeon]
MKTQKKSAATEAKISWIFFVGILLVSSSTLMFEITITRIFSYMLAYQYTFIVISIALLGIGLGSAYAGNAETSRIYMQSPLAKLAFILGISTILSGGAIVLMPYSNLFLYFILTFIPFFFSGALLATIYKTFGMRSHIIYFSDLAGAAAGSAIIVPLLDLLGAIRVIPLISAVAAVGAILFSASFNQWRQHWRLALILLVALPAFLLMPLFSGQNPPPLGGDQGKELYSLLNDASSNPRLVESRWDSFSRTDLVDIGADPHVKAIFTDGGAGTSMYHFDGNFSSTPDLINLRSSTTYFPFNFRGKDNVLIIGPGGGVDVLAALMGGSKRVTAVEVNPQTVEIVRDYSSYNGGIYSNYPNVSIFVDEGRSFLKRSTDKYDVIMLNIPITKTMENVGGYALSENYLFTVESFKDYLNHLKEDGRLVIVAHDDTEIYRLSTIALKVFEEQGKSAQETLAQISVVGNPSAHGGHMSFPVFILKNSPFEDGEVKAMYAKTQALGLISTYLPNTPSTDQVLSALASGTVTLETLLRTANVDITPVTDDRPFFYKFEQGLPPSLSAITIFIPLLALLLVALEKSGRPKRGRAYSTSITYYFSLLGAGFMFIEVALIQKFSLFLGYPTLSLSVLLTSFLASSGFGSFVSKRLKSPIVMKVPLLVSGVVIAYALALPTILSTLFSLPLSARIATSLALVFPLGFFMGMPFPAGMSKLKMTAEERIPWMWGLNGVFSLFGSILAISIAMALGFSYTLLIGAAAYIMVFLVGRRALNL